MSVAESKGYSAQVSIKLRVAGKVLRVAQVGQWSLILRETGDVPPCEAEVVITVDGQDRVHAVYLPHGITAGSPVVEFL